MTLDFLDEIPISHPMQEGNLQASKWQHIRMLLDPLELRELFAHIEPFFLMNIAAVCSQQQLMTTHERFISSYEEYVAAIKQGDASAIQEYRKQCSSALSKTLDPFYLMQVQQGKFLVKLKTPIIRLQNFHFHYIAEQGEFVLGQHARESISWGLEFSFPQFYQDRETCLPIEVLKDPAYPNTHVFKMIQKWMREYTVPAPFMIDGHKKIAPFRLGKKCFNWINLYSELCNQGLFIYEHRSDHHR